MSRTTLKSVFVHIDSIPKIALYGSTVAVEIFGEGKTVKFIFVFLQYYIDNWAISVSGTPDPVPPEFE